MSLTLKEIEEELDRLSEEDRARLAEHLLASLDEGEDVDAEKAWVAEAEARYQLYRKGQLDARPADDIFEDAFRKLNEKD